MNLLKSGPFLRDAERQFRFYLLESDLDYGPALELSLRFKDALEQTIRLIHQNPRIGRRRLRAYPDILEARSKIVQRPFDRFRIFYHIEKNQFSWIV